MDVSIKSFIYAIPSRENSMLLASREGQVKDYVIRQTKWKLLWRRWFGLENDFDPRCSPQRQLGSNDLYWNGQRNLYR